MSTDRKPDLSDLFPLPANVRLRRRTFGATPVSPLTPTPPGGDGADSAAVPRPPFKAEWTNEFNRDDGVRTVKVVVRERNNGHLIADVFCSDPGLLGRGAVSVGLVGAAADRTVRKTIPLDIPETDGCSGSADFGPLTEVVNELGAQLGVVTFLVI